MGITTFLLPISINTGRTNKIRIAPVPLLCIALGTEPGTATPFERYHHFLCQYHHQLSRTCSPVKESFDRRLQKTFNGGAKVFLGLRLRNHCWLLRFRLRMRFFLRNSSSSRRRWGTPLRLLWMRCSSWVRGVESLTIKATV